MEKLIELLNEYGKDFWNYESYYGFYIDDKTGYEELRICSKGYGFIKRLVDNDKIDRKKLSYKNLYISDYGSSDDIFLAYNKGEQGIIYTVDYYESLLMLLSISDKPIDFLCDIIQ